MMPRRVVRDDALQRVVPALQHVIDVVADAGDAADGALDRAQALVEPGRAACARQVGAEGADAGADAHVVVVEHHDQLEIAVGAAVVERLEGVALLQRAVADHRHGLAPRVGLAAAPGEGEAHGGGDAGAAVAGLDRVVGRLGGIGKARQALPLAQGGELLAAPGEQLVRIALVADVPDQLVAAVELVLGEQRQGQLDDAEAGAEMTAGASDRVDDEAAQVTGEGAQALGVHVLDVVRRAERVEQWVGGLWRGSHLRHATPDETLRKERVSGKPRTM